VQENCEIDPKFIQEHILEALGNQQEKSQRNDALEYRSLSGQCFKTIEYELHIIKTQAN